MIGVIHKFPLEITDEQELWLPAGADILTAQMQGEKLVLWAVVDPAAEHEEKRMILVRGTGHPINMLDVKFIATAQDKRPPTLVWHVFEKNGLRYLRDKIT